MEQFRSNPKKSGPESTSKKEILNHWDKDVLKAGIQNLTLKMVEDFGSILPEVIILPDTSARPLMYALRPVFQTIAQEKNCAVPRIYFFKTDRSRHLSTIERLKEEDGGGHYNIEDIIANAHIEEMFTAREAMRERAQEIKSEETKRNNEYPTIAIIDEYASEDAYTIEEIRKAFGTNIKAYSVFSISEGGKHFTPGVNIGDDPDDSNPDKGFFKLSYSQTDSVGVKKTKYDGKKYATRINTINEDAASNLSEEKKKLRNEMRSIGESISETT